jgi:amino acid permease
LYPKHSYMLGLLLIYFVGKKFYELAFEYDKSKWGFAIAGVVSYYAGFLVSVFIIAAIVEINSPGYINESNELLFSVLGIPFGVAVCWGFYKILEKNWSKSRSAQPDTLDGAMINDNTNHIN